jgi:RHS repeat-associated protein
MDATYTGTIAEGISTTMFDATHGYDKNGNIGYLKRTTGGGATLMDELIYSYSANQLTKVVDDGDATKGFKDKVNTTDYGYDQAGNMITDANKDLSIAYNHLNLPATITRTNSGTKNGTIKHYYAGATKIRMETYDAAGTTLVKAYDYLAGMVYQETVTAGNSTKELDFVASPEGRAILTKKVLNLTTDPTTGDKFRFEYSLKDHLGNLRVSCRCGEPKRDAQGIIIPEGTSGAGIEPLAVVQEQHYDPWGLAFSTPLAPPSGAGGADRFSYNSKELVTDLDLGWNDYGFRMYDASVGRWSSVDHLADKREWLTPYNMTQNNPINRIDPDGAFDTKADAQQYAVDHNIRTGWFSRNKIEKAADGSFAINNRREHSSTSNDKDFGITTGALVTPGSRMTELSQQVIANYNSGTFFTQNPNDNRDYSPLQSPDAISLSVPISASGGLGSGGGEIGIAIGLRKPGVAIYLNETIGVGGQVPGVGTGLNLNIHNTYGREKNVFSGLSGRSYGYDGQAYFGAGYTSSGKNNNLQYSTSGTKTLTLGLRPSIGSYGGRATLTNTNIWYIGGN